MKTMELSKRMQAVADMVLPGGVVADVGCDHAFVSIYLIENEMADRVIASDVRKGPVEIARRNVAGRNLQDRIDIRMGDGLSTLSVGEADTIILAGMGGLLMLDILKRQEAVVCGCRQMVLQPQSDVEKVRAYVDEKHYYLASEKMLVDAGKYYNILDIRIKNDAEIGQLAQSRLENVNIGRTLEHRMENPETGQMAKPWQEETKIEKRTELWLEDIENEQTTESPLEVADMQRLFQKFGGHLLMERDAVLFDYIKKKAAVNEKLLDELKDKKSGHAEMRRQDIEKELADMDAVLKYFYHYESGSSNSSPE